MSRGLGDVYKRQPMNTPKYLSRHFMRKILPCKPSHEKKPERETPLIPRQIPQQVPNRNSTSPAIQSQPLPLTVTPRTAKPPTATPLATTPLTATPLAAKPLTAYPPLSGSSDCASSVFVSLPWSAGNHVQPATKKRIKQPQPDVTLGIPSQIWYLSLIHI